MLVTASISAMVFMMVQAVLFGFGVISVLATPLSAYAQILIPAVTIVSAILSLWPSWAIARRMRARYWRKPRTGFVDRTLASLA